MPRGRFPWAFSRFDSHPDYCAFLSLFLRYRMRIQPFRKIIFGNSMRDQIFNKRS